MEILKVLEFIQSPGYLAGLIFIGYVVWQIKKNVDSQGVQIKEISDKLERKINKEDCVQCKDGLNQELINLVEKNDLIRNDMLVKEDFYRMFSGWRTEIQFLSQKIDNYLVKE